MCDRTPSAQLPTSAVLTAGVPIIPALFVRDLGIYIDADLSMRIHVQRTVSRCFAALRQLRQIRRCVPATTFQMLVVALVHSRLDYGNSMLMGTSAYSRSPCWLTEFFTVARRDTWDRSHASPTFLVDGTSVQPPSIVSSCRRSNCTVGSRAFLAAASSIWNSLPEYIVITHLLYSHFNII